MRRTAKFTRRRFLQVTAAAAAAGPFLGCGRLSPWRSFTADEAETVAALCNQIIPADQDPGAAWAGVVIFIDRQLAGPYRKFRKNYRAGLAGVNQTSQGMFGKRFIELDPAGQLAVMTALEKGRATGDAWKQLPSPQFFDLVVSHTMQGFYGDPRHGGNREGVSWRMVGLAYPPIRGRLHYDLTKPKVS